MSTIAKVEVFGVENAPHVRVVAINGRLDETNINQLESKVDPLVQDPVVKALIFQCKELQYINSKVVGYLASTYSIMSQKAGKVIVSEPNPGLLDIINMVGLTMIIDQAKTMEEALQIAGAVAAEPVVASTTSVKNPASEDKTEPPVAMPEPEMSVPASAKKDMSQDATPPAEVPVDTPATEVAKEENKVSLSSTQTATSKKASESKPQKPETLSPTPVAQQQDQRVVIMLELPDEASMDGTEVFRSESGHIEVKLVPAGEKLGRHLELSFQPGKYFFRGNMSAEKSSPEKKDKGALFGWLGGR